VRLSPPHDSRAGACQFVDWKPIDHGWIIAVEHLAGNRYDNLPGERRTARACPADGQTRVTAHRHGLSQFSKCTSRRLSISFLMSLMSANWPQRVTSQILGAPSISTMNSSTNASLSRYFSRRCCLQMSAVCFCRFFVPNPILGPNHNLNAFGRRSRTQAIGKGNSWYCSAPTPPSPSLAHITAITKFPEAAQRIAGHAGSNSLLTCLASRNAILLTLQRVSERRSCLSSSVKRSRDEIVMQGRPHETESIPLTALGRSAATR
jgi:hypothetical protein